MYQRSSSFQIFWGSMHSMVGSPCGRTWHDWYIIAEGMGRYWDMTGPQIAGHFKNISSQPKNFVSHDASLAIMLLTNWQEGVEIPKLIINQSSFVNSTHILYIINLNPCLLLNSYFWSWIISQPGATPLPQSPASGTGNGEPSASACSVPWVGWWDGRRYPRVNSRRCGKPIFSLFENDLHMVGFRTYVTLPQVNAMGMLKSMGMIQHSHHNQIIRYGHSEW